MNPARSVAGLVCTPLRLLGAAAARVTELTQSEDPDRQAEIRAELALLLAEHARTNELLERLATAVAARATGEAAAESLAPAAVDKIDALLAAQQETQTVLTRVLAAQRRTNDLLELSFRAAFDPDDEVVGS